MDLPHTHTALFHEDYSCNLVLAFTHDYFALLKGVAELVWDDAQIGHGHGHIYIYLNLGWDLPLCVELLTVDMSRRIHSGPRVVW